ncbi:MAG: inositol 2-dehydrogenase, partial [Candidatus Hydrogenedentes bacterium]|nr:inositol 2-dehydrogenase [Candidatus Hydrogenedentota bacterium]
MRLGIIGCGVLGKFHAPCAVKAGFRITACADPVHANAEALAG